MLDEIVNNPDLNRYLLPFKEEQVMSFAEMVVSEDLTQSKSDLQGIAYVSEESNESIDRPEEQPTQEKGILETNAPVHSSTVAAPRPAETENKSVEVMRKEKAIITREEQKVKLGHQADQAASTNGRRDILHWIQATFEKKNFHSNRGHQEVRRRKCGSGPITLSSFRRSH